MCAGMVLTYGVYGLYGRVTPEVRAFSVSFSIR